MLISVIIPVYNVEPYLGKCLDSVCQQTYQDIEVLLVDDGSKDQSFQICKAYEEQYPFVKAYTKENGGVVSALQIGIDQAKGDFICFIDSDDFVASNYVEQLVAGLEPGVDMVCCEAMRYFDDSHQEKYEVNTLEEGIYDIQDELLSRMICDAGSYRKIIANARWSKLMRASLVKECQQYCSTEISYGEDQQLILGMIARCKKVHILKNYLYYYRYNLSSVVNTYKKGLWLKIKTLMKTIASIPNMEQVPNYKTQMNTQLILYANDCIKNELYYKKKEYQKNIKLILQDEDLKVALLDYSCEKMGNLDRKMLKPLKKRSLLGLKFVFLEYRLYCKLKNKQVL